MRIGRIRAAGPASALPPVRPARSDPVSARRRAGRADTAPLTAAESRAVRALRLTPAGVQPDAVPADAAVPLHHRASYAHHQPSQLTATSTRATSRRACRTNVAGRRTRCRSNVATVQLWHWSGRQSSCTAFIRL